MSDREIALLAVIDELAGRYRRMAFDVAELLAVAVAANEKGHNDVVSERIDAALDDIRCGVAKLDETMSRV